MPFPHWALWCFKHSAVAERVHREPRGGHITFNLRSSSGSELYGRRRAAPLSHTPQKCLSSPRHSPVSTVYFSTVAPGLLSGGLTFDSSAQLQVAHHRGLRVCELSVPLPIFSSVWSEATRKRKVLPQEDGGRMILQYSPPQAGTSCNVFVTFATV